MTIRLHCFGESGHSYKAALTLQVAGLDWAPVPVAFFDGATRDPGFRAEINEMGEAPVLEADGLRLTQSGVIQQWIAEQTGRLGGAPGDRHEILRWQFWDNHKLSSQAGAVRFLMNYLPAEKRAQQEPTIAFLQTRLQGALGVLEARLSGRDWIVGEAPSIADLTCCGYLFYDEPFGFDRGDWPAIDAWLARIAALPGWMPPYELMPPARPENRKG